MAVIGDEKWQTFLDRLHAKISAASAPPKLFTLVLLSGLSVVSLNMFLPSLSNIAAEFQAGYGLLATVSIAGYAGTTTVLQLLIGPLSDRVGRRPVVLVSLVIFVLASLGCLLARDVWTFLLFRTMQAAIVSGFVLSRVIIRDTEPAQKAASLMGYLSIAWAIAPMLAPMLGGAFDQLFGWRANFWAFLGFGAGMLALCWIDLGETNKNPSDTFTKQFKAFPSLFRSRRFWGYSLCMAFSMGALYAFLAAAPLVATAVFQMSPATLGFYMGSTAAGFILGSFVSGRFAARYPLTTMMVAGRVVAFAGLAVGLWEYDPSKESLAWTAFIKKNRDLEAAAVLQERVRDLESRPVAGRERVVGAQRRGHVTQRALGFLELGVGFRRRQPDQLGVLKPAEALLHVVGGLTDRDVSHLGDALVEVGVHGVAADRLESRATDETQRGIRRNNLHVEIGRAHV